MGYLSNKVGDPNDLGYFATPVALASAYPIGAAGYFALVGSTDTIWVWDTGTNAWVDSGAGGANAFVYIAYASDAIGTGFTMTFNAALDYIAIKNTTVAIPSPSASDFVGLWKNYKGTPGTGSGDMLSSVYDPSGFHKSLQPQLINVSKTANYTANVNELVSCNVSGGSFKVTLPSAPADKSVIAVKLDQIGINRVLTLATSGTDKFNTSTGTVEIYMYLFGEYAWCEYDATNGLWHTFISAGTYNFATNFPGIDSTTPLSAADISFNTGTRVLTITPPLGYFNVFTDGGGVITRFRKVGTVNFPAITNTSGFWYFYFDNTGTAISTQTPAVSYDTVAMVYRVIWNSVTNSTPVELWEAHTNTVPGIDHTWKHIEGTKWASGFNMFNNVLASGAPNADGRNAVVSLSSGMNIDDNLLYTINNSAVNAQWNQDLGLNTPASLNATNGAQFKVRLQDGSGNISYVAASTFPFSFSAVNVIEWISSTGVRTAVSDTDFVSYFIYSIQDPRFGEALKVVSSPAQYTNLAGAQAFSWNDIKTTYPSLADNEIRPLYKLIYESRTTYNVGTKKAALRQVDDIRLAQVTQSTAAIGSVNASAVVNVPAGNIASTNVQDALNELDTEKAPLRPVATKVTLVNADEITGNDSAASFGQIKTTWGNVKTYLSNVFAPINNPTFTGEVRSTGKLFVLNENRVTRFTEFWAKNKNQSNLGGVTWKIFTDADNSLIGNRKWELWGYPEKTTDGTTYGYEPFISCEFPTADDITYTKKVTINAPLIIDSNSYPQQRTAYNGSSYTDVGTTVNGHYIISPTANVGIGITTPPQKLSVVGNADITGSIELGHATDTTISRVSAGVIAVEGVTVPTISSTTTLTNKRIQPRVVSTTTTATLTPDLASGNVFNLTAQTGALTIAAPTGTPVAGEVIIINVSTAAAQTLTPNAVYKFMGVALPASTTAGKWITITAQCIDSSNFLSTWAIQA